MNTEPDINQIRTKYGAILRSKMQYYDNKRKMTVYN